MLTTNQLCFSYSGGPKSFSFPNLQLSKSEAVLILGNSGTGKTTLLHLLGGILKPTSGSIQIGPTELTQLSSKQLDAFRGENIGIVFQKPHFVQSLTLLQNLEFAQYLTKTHDTSPIELLNRLNIGDLKNKRMHELSEGEKQRASIARALINNPSVILADEPTASLDDTNAKAVLTLLQEQAELTQAALVVVTHDQRVKNVIAHQIEITA